MKQCFVDKITEILGEFSIVENLARKKFISEFVVGLIQSRNVQFCEVAQHLRDSAKIGSNEVRIQDFFREVSLDYLKLGVLLLSFLPRRRKLRLCLDRTNWEFGRYSCNILMVSVGCQDWSLPLYWEMLDNKGGNSSQDQRIDLLSVCVELLGVRRIGLVIGDREFIGHRWLKYLKDRCIKFIVRFPKHHKIHRLDGRVQKAEEFELKVGQILTFSQVMVNGVVGNASLQLLTDGAYLLLFGTTNVRWMEQIYKQRWSIEVCFQNFKGRGFDLEKTHLQSNKKIKMLVALVSVTYGLVVSIGRFYHQKVSPIKKRIMDTKPIALPERGSI